MDRFRAAENDYRAGRWLRADCESVGSREERSSEMWAGAATFAAGLRVPKAYGDYLILDILKKSRERRWLRPTRKSWQRRGTGRASKAVFAAPEGSGIAGGISETACQRLLSRRR